MNTITLPATTSALINVLLRVIAGWEIPWQVAASAAELIVLDLRFSDWVLTVAKPSGSPELLNKALEQVDRRAKLVEQAWARYESAPNRELEALRDAIASAQETIRKLVENEQAEEV